MAKAAAARYGEVLNRNTKQINNLSVRSDDLVVSGSRVFESVSATDVYEIENAGVIYYPASEGIFDPMLPGFFPMGAY